MSGVFEKLPLLMSNRSRNIIVTCGTSQIESKYATSTLSISETQIETLKQSAVQLSDHTIAQVADSKFEDRKTQQLFNEIYGKLAVRWGDLDSRVWTNPDQRRRNCFGAELSSLVLMRKQYDYDLGRYSFWEASDRLTILYSDTLLGVFSAALLCKLASEQWKMGTVDWAFRPDGPQPAHPPRVRAIRVPGLFEDVEDPKAMDDELVNRLRDAMHPRSSVCDDAIVFTGGFKFMIPILTAFAMAHGIKLYYRYEKVYDIRSTIIPSDYREAIRKAAEQVRAAQARDNPIQRAMSIQIDPPGQLLEKEAIGPGPPI